MEDDHERQQLPKVRTKKLNYSLDMKTMGTIHSLSWYKISQGIFMQYFWLCGYNKIILVPYCKSFLWKRKTGAEENQIKKWHRSRVTLLMEFSWGKNVFHLLINCYVVWLINVGYLCLVPTNDPISLVSSEDISSWEAREHELIGKQYTPLEAALSHSGLYSSWHHCRMKWFLIVLLIFRL